MSVGAGHFVVVSAALFGIGVFGLLARRSAVGSVMGLVLMTTGADIALVGFSRLGYTDVRPLSGMAFALLAGVVLTAQVLLAAGLLLLVARRGGEDDAPHQGAGARPPA